MPDTYISSINFSNPVLIFIIICFGIGVLCALRSIWRIHHAFSRQLEKFTLYKDISKAGQEAERKNLLRQWLSDNLIQQDKKKSSLSDKELPPPDSHTYSPLYMRVYSLHRALEDDNGARQLPQLHDLRELSMQDEMSRFSVATLRTIISFLLIVGIFGTLHGVHAVIGEWGASSLEKINVKNLSPALEPSMFAVAFTVILMWLRGGYSYFLQRYLLKLDQMTMENLLPHLQPESQTQGSHRAIVTNISGFARSMDKITDQLKKLKITFDKLQEKTSSYNMASNSLDQIIAQTKESVTTLAKHQKDQNEKIQQTEKVITSTENERLASLKINAGILKRYKEAADRTHSSYTKLTDVSSRSLAKLRENIQIMNRIADTVHSLPTYADNMRKYTADLGETVRLRDNIDTALNIITGHQDVMNQLAQKTYGTALEAQHSFATATGHLEDIAAIEAQYQADIQSYMLRLNTTHEDVKKEANSLNEANKKLFDAFTKRKNTITTESQS